MKSSPAAPRESAGDKDTESYGASVTPPPFSRTWKREGPKLKACGSQPAALSREPSSDLQTTSQALALRSNVARSHGPAKAPCRGYTVPFGAVSSSPPGPVCSDAGSARTDE